MHNRAVIGLILIACLGGVGWYVLRAPSEPNGVRGGSEFPPEHAKPKVDQTAALPGPGAIASPPVDANELSLVPTAADATELEGLVLAEQFDSLLSRTRNNPAYAFTLASALQHCTRAEPTYRTLDHLASRRTVAETEASLVLADEAFAKCKGLTPKQLDERISLMETAAAAGVLEAQIRYRDVVEAMLEDRSAIRKPGALDTLRARVEAFTTAAAATGDARGLYAAYKLYSDGGLVQPDLVKAYGFATAFARQNPSAASQATLARLEGRMTPDELRRARGG